VPVECACRNYGLLGLKWGAWVSLNVDVLLLYLRPDRLPWPGPRFSALYLFEPDKLV